ncbi:MAG: hypothetical protein NTW97_03655 [Candidatus Krumholzibacteria bacterium]|nr:hypothetical protein [Candidatus Krumholzibacteria bacterium]
MKKLGLFLLAAILCAAGGHAFGDTGTYRIVSYRVGLTPHSDGTVAIDYYQKWYVTGGHIPWITVGTPNGNFAITGSGGAVSGAESASESGWSGVRLDLDRDYRPGETFEASFSIVQKGLFYAEEGNYKLEFTPGWYDRAPVDTLRVGVKFFASLATVKADPKPSVVSDEAMIWGNYSLGPGGRLTIHVTFPVGLFPAGIDKSNLRGASGGSASAGHGVVMFIVVGFIVFFVILALFSSKGRYSGGRIFYGGIPGGRAGGGRSGGGRSGSGGGGFGGASMSCACACVSCACACACAGGGGAGCSRKLEHTCPVCGKKRGS